MKSEKVKSVLPCGGCWELVAEGEEWRWSLFSFKTGLDKEKHKLTCSANIQDTVKTEVRGQNVPMLDERKRAVTCF